MGLFSNLFNSSSKNKSGSNNDYVSDEDYNAVQNVFRKILDAQNSGDNKKAQKEWDNFKKDSGYEI